jgi:cytochrome c556
MKTMCMTCLIVTMLVLPPALGAEETASDQGDVKLSQALLELLRAEMREVTIGVQGIATAIATGNWELVKNTSSKIRASYIMEKKLSASQSAELDALPDEFRLLDAEFHSRAEKIGAAAASKDSELAVHHYSRMLESCTECHSRFARARFPGFATSAQGVHQH